MKSLIMFALAATLTFFAQEVRAQEGEILKTSVIEEEVKIAEARKKLIVEEEKEALKEKVAALKKQFEAGEISEAAFEKKKVEAAGIHALNIENRTAIIDNRLELIKRNGIDSMLSEEPVDVDLFQNGKILDITIKPHKVKYDRRTYSDFVLGFGLNNAIIDGQSFDDSPYKIGGSRFAELGWAWKTRVFKNTAWLRVKYGFSFQFNGLKPTDNRIFVDTGGMTELQTFELDLDKSKFRMDNLVIPFHFEFGPYKKVQKENSVRYYSGRKFKLGLGGYAGVNLRTVQKLKYKGDEGRIKEKQRADFNTNNFVYGLSGYVALGGVAVYGKYDLNPIFKNGPAQRNVSLGVRFDMD